MDRSEFEADVKVVEILWWNHGNVSFISMLLECHHRHRLKGFGEEEVEEQEVEKEEVVVMVVQRWNVWGVGQK